MKHSFSDLTMWVVSICVFAAVFICIICNLAVTNTIGWLVYPVCSLLFGWLVLMPVLYYKKRGLKVSLGIITALLLPFLLVLDQFNGAAEWFLPIGVPIAATGIKFMWVLYGLLMRQRSIWLTLPAVIFLSGLLCICIDQIIKNALGEAGFPWGYLVASITSLIAIIISVLGFVLKKRSVQTE